MEILCIVMNMAIGSLGTYLWLRFVGPHYGTKVKVPHVNRRTLVALAVVVWLLGSTLIAVQSFKTDREVRDLTLGTRDCFRQLTTALTVNNQIRKQNDDLSMTQRDALAKTQTALYKWLSVLLTPPADIAALPDQDQRRRDFNIGISRDFSDELVDSNRVIADAAATQVRLEASRVPLPELTCGQ